MSVWPIAGLLWFVLYLFLECNWFWPKRGQVHLILAKTHYYIIPGIDFPIHVRFRCMYLVGWYTPETRKIHFGLASSEPTPTHSFVPRERDVSTALKVIVRLNKASGVRVRIVRSCLAKYHATFAGIVHTTSRSPRRRVVCSVSRLQ